VIGSQYCHDSVSITAIEVKSAQTDGWRCAAANGLGYEVLCGQFRRLIRQAAHVLAARDDEDLLRLEERSDSIDSVLEHRPIPNQSQRLLGTITAADRPQSGSGPTGHDEGIE
jgi:hypothetical protein